MVPNDKYDEQPFYEEGEYFGDWLSAKKRRTMPEVVEPPTQLIVETPIFTTSLTPNAVQQSWHIPSEFPCCPKEPTDTPILSYVANLTQGKIFCCNELYRSTVSEFAVSADNTMIWVLGLSSSSIKPYALARITFRDNKYVHTSLSSFFSPNGAKKQFCIAQGLEWTGEESIDDYC